MELHSGAVKLSVKEITFPFFTFLFAGTTAAFPFFTSRFYACHETFHTPTG